MGFFNQQSHNMPKSGVSLEAVIIFSCKEIYSIDIEAYLQVMHIHRYEYNLRMRWSPYAWEQRVNMATFSDSSDR